MKYLKERGRGTKRGSFVDSADNSSVHRHDGQQQVMALDGIQIMCILDMGLSRAYTVSHSLSHSVQPTEGTIDLRFCRRCFGVIGRSVID